MKRRSFLASSFGAAATTALAWFSLARKSPHPVGLIDVGHRASDIGPQPGLTEKRSAIMMVHEGIYLNLDLPVRQDGQWYHITELEWVYDPVDGGGRINLYVNCLLVCQWITGQFKQVVVEPNVRCDSAYLGFSGPGSKGLTVHYSLYDPKQV